MVGDKTDIYPLAVHSLEHVTLHKLHDALMSTNLQVLSHNALNRASKCNFDCQVSSNTGIVGYMELGIEIALCNQLCTLHLIDVLTSSQVHLLVEEQLRCSCAVEVLIRIWISWIYHNHLFLYTEGQWLIGSEFHEDIILVQEIQEHTSEVLFLLCTRSNYPVFLDDSTSRAIQTHIKCHVCSSATIVSNHKLEFITTVLDIGKVQTIPLLTCRY